MTLRIVVYLPCPHLITTQFHSTYAGCVHMRCQDEGMSLVLREVGHMVKPPQALFSPGIVAKVALYRLRRLIGRLRPSGVAQTLRCHETYVY